METRIDDLLCFSLFRAHQAMGKVYRTLLDPLGLTYPQYLVLVSLWQSDSKSVKALAQELSLESNTLTPLLKRVESAGLIVRQRNPEDERSVIVSLTEQGKALQKKAENVTGCVIAASGMTIDEAKDLKREIDHLSSALGAAQHTTD
ncbi:MarR family winged helix-turn-helix transcriptional regulator [Cognatishimia activa]|uniref:MarR family winged helix-turn-helix transcriptional regulator n=1 Tax=Cognatishimia activa TaxID=1715691 RepID=UPI00223299D6|nr:MarR family transcriptional regulator [Cognatishimia activa]UZD90800.1 MarR family transcriptional regulator [Cognatishimia activa]